MSLETKLQDASQDFQKLQVDLAQAVEARQQLDAQLSENEQVKKVEDIHYQLSTHTKSWWVQFRNSRNLNQKIRYIN